ncbi:uncharacterized protein LOC126662068 [Mercurialis annua]|uniref:uncharacterized protein LOC126662068 n=1 Tax=Mercurialis annua TaxID=3986 RepID=UPI00215F0624|nr:uncharacterized protein LOC126662068 [Mercurialis annua]
MTSLQNPKTLPPPPPLSPPVIYFENFPEQWFFSDLQRAFAKYFIQGRVTLARKKNRANKRFGFLHMEPNQDVRDTLYRLNNVFIGSWRIRAFISKYPQANPNPKPTTSAPIVTRVPKQIIHHSIRDSRSYVDVVNRTAIAYTSPLDVGKLQKTSVIVTLKHITDVLHVGSYLQNRGIGFESYSLLGGFQVLLNFFNHDDQMQFMKIFPTLAEFFVLVSPWNGFFTSGQRFVWISFTGIPLIAWDEGFFTLLGNHFGNTISVRPLVSSKERMDSGSVLISTSETHIECDFYVKVNNKEVPIHASESDIPISLDIMEEDSSEYTSDSEGNSLSKKSGDDERLLSVLAGESDVQAGDTRSKELPSIQNSSRSSDVTPKGSLHTCTQNTYDIAAASDGLIKGCNKQIQSVSLIEETADMKAQKTWAVGLQMGIFSPNNEQAIISLLSQGILGGLSFSRKQRIIRSFVSKHALSLVGLIETKKEIIDDFLSSRLWPNGDYCFCFSPSSGASGGLLCLWDKRVLTACSIITDSRWICIDFQFYSTVFRFILVYGCSLAAERISLWDNLAPYLSSGGPCILVGDFNEILQPSERLNCNAYSASMVQFAEFIQSSNLVEATLHGRFFYLFFSSWPNLSLQALSRNFSDHCPILFRSAVHVDWVGRIFRLLFPNANLVIKLRELRKRIKNSINDLEGSEDVRSLSDIEISLLASLRNDFNSVSSQIESLWLQKSRLNWSLFGDKNSKFFHTAAVVHSRSNRITSITVHNHCYSKPEDVKHHVHLFYKNLYSRHSSSPYSLDSLDIRQLSDVQAADLCNSFSEEEIFSTLSGCDENKAPGPNGFNYFFYKRAWPILKQDLMDLFGTFHSSSTFPAGLNTAFLVLIPKLAGASDVTDFRPISLINGIFKLLSKALSNRLAPLLPLIISENQFGFIKGRSIHDCHMIAFELIHLAHRRRDQMFLIKLDFKKAFDSISWDFILKMLVKMNFSTTWIKWIASFFDSAQLSVLINGSPSQNFKMERGVRQGDPLSPMLFVLAVEGHKAMLSKAVEINLIDGILVDGYSEPVSILQFANDTLLFLPNDLEMVNNLLRILRCFELVSGLQINFQKSAIIGIYVDNTSLESASSILGCKIDSLPITYLGLPSSLKPVKENLWNPVVCNFSSRLATWKCNLLSPAGRLILIKSVLSSLPVYFLGSLRIPQSVVQNLERLMRRFLWSGNVQSSGFSKVAWKDVCIPFEGGRLGITPLRIKNQSLLTKWIWKIMTVTRSSLWFMVVTCSNGFSRWFELQMADSRHLSHIWRDIFVVCIRNQFSLVSKVFNSSQRAFAFNWRRRLRVGEAAQLEDLQQLLSGIVPSSLIQDQFFWLGNQIYSPASMVKALSSSSILSSSARLTKSGYFWRFKIPPRILFFMWLLCRDRISSNMILVRRGVLNQDFSSCLACREAETSLHIILHCNVAIQTWNIIHRRCNLLWAAPPSIFNFFDYWCSIANRRHINLWRTLWFFLGVAYYKDINKGFVYTGNDVLSNLHFFCHNVGICIGTGFIYRFIGSKIDIALIVGFTGLGFYCLVILFFATYSISGYLKKKKLLDAQRRPVPAQNQRLQIENRV